MQGTTGSATVGIIDGDGDYGLEVVYNIDDYIQDQMTVSFDTAPDWLQISPDDLSGEILSGESAIYNLTANSNDVDNLFKRDREAIANIIQQHLRDVTINPESVFDKGEIDEMNTTGGGASFNAGAGEGYMTPRAFKKKNKED